MEKPWAPGEATSGAADRCASAPVVPLRSDEDELVLLETAVLDHLDEEHDTQPSDQPLDDSVAWLARQPGPPTRRRRPRT